MSFSSDDLDSVGELYTEGDFRQLVVSVEATPACLGGLGELEVRIPTKPAMHSDLKPDAVPT